MAFYDKFPYTNFQELNLDWLTQEVSKVRDNRDASDASAAAALASEQAAKASETAAAASQQAAANSETEAAGSEAASAEYLAQIGTHTAGAVADWLKENLQPTTPPVDESLTVSGAAADAKVTGDRITDTTGNERINATRDAYINLSAGIGGTADINSPVSNAGSSYAVKACTGSDQFTLTTHGGADGRAYGFLDANGVILEVAPISADFNKLILTAPANSAYLVANSRKGFDLVLYSGALLTNKVAHLSLRQKELIEVLNSDLFVKPVFTAGKSITESGSLYDLKSNSATVDFIRVLKGSSIFVTGNRDFIIARYSKPELSGFTACNQYSVTDYQTVIIDEDCYIRVASNTKNISDDITFMLFNIPAKDQMLNIPANDQLLWYGMNGIDFELGGINANSGENPEITNGARARTGFINALKGSKIHFRSTAYQYTVYEYYSDTSYYYAKNNLNTDWRTDDYIVENQDVAYIRIVAKRIDGGDITDVDIAYFAKNMYVDAISQNAKEICIESVPGETFKTNTVEYDGEADLTYGEIISGYDELLTDFPDYVTKKTLGQDSSGDYTIYQYVFTPEFVPKLTLNYTGKNYNDGTIPTIILDAGVHGAEKPITRALLNFMSAICKDWESNDILAYLRSNFRFVVNPCAVPWGYEHNSRFNANGVNINRNFDGMDQWKYGSDVIGNPNYRGSAPLSEVEAQYINETLKEYKNTAILYYSFHTYGLADAYTHMMCWAWGTYVKPNEMFIAGYSVLNKITRNALVLHNYPKNTATNPKYIGCMQASNGKNYKGGYTCNQGNSYGIPSACPEGIYYKYGDPSTRNSHDINCINTEFIAITIMEALKQLY